MNIGFIGLGKLGLPCAMAIESKGHNVIGYDIDKNVNKILLSGKLPYQEEGAPELLEKTNIKIVSPKEIVSRSEIIFIAVQTPHEKQYEGITRLPSIRKNFNYDYLKNAIKILSNEIKKQKQEKIVIIISTVLPGTIRKEIIPLINDYVKLCYNPFFIAMGTTIKDFLFPEFVLFGVYDKYAANKSEEFYKTLHNRPFIKMSIESAELTKVAYNTFITSKIVITNILMEICHKIPNADIDEVTNALKLATDRIVSTRYMNGGMGDGGGCHPRDNIALSWLAKELDLSYDIYYSFMKARESQTEWLAELIAEEYFESKLPIVILGTAFKKNINLEIGSPVLLLENILKEKGINVITFDPFKENKFSLKEILKQPHLYFIGMNHDIFKENLEFPEGSIVIDPWRIIKKRDNIKLISIGSKN